VTDSDTGAFVVRFAGIDAPKTGQAYWCVARDRLRQIAGPGTVAYCYKQDQYGRQVCRLKSADGKDLADTIIGEGLAWHAVRFANEETDTERERYVRLEAEAKSAKKGLGTEPDPMPRWECRQLRKKHQKCRYRSG
jgi:endonuclease YncB( thermonuclease family)